MTETGSGVPRPGAPRQAAPPTGYAPAPGYNGTRPGADATARRGGYDERASATVRGRSAGAPSGIRQAPPVSGPPVNARRKARLALTHIDPWSVTKLAFVFSFVAGVLLVVAVAVLWFTLDAMGVFTSLSETIAGVTKDESGGGFVLMDYVGLSKVLTVVAVIAAVDVVLLTALGTLAAFVYNLGSGLTGGLEVTLAEEF